jgi:integrase
MNAWLFQDRKQKQKLGDKAPWSVGWYDPEGKRREKKIGSHSAAEKYARRTEGQLAAGTYESKRNTKWTDFRKEYLERGMPGAAPRTIESAESAMDRFERVINPVRVNAITSRTFAQYVALRTAPRPVEEVKESPDVEEGKKPRAVKKGKTPRPPISPATVNKELRHLRAIVRKAHKWGYLPRVPEIDFLKEPGKLPTYVTPEHFAKLYQHADAARWPADGHYDVADWWRALFVMAYLTGWRIGSLMALRWVDVDLENGFAISRAADNKGKRDQRVPLHPVVIEHLKKLVCFSATVFAWEHGRRALFGELETIQTAAGVKPEGDKARYGFHDFRRAFATMNAAGMSPDALQALMQHKDYQTTQRYINMARQLNPAVQSLFVPDMPKTARA